VPPHVFARVRELVARLVDGCGMDFPDLTGYNVMIDFDNTDQMWLVDFEHARDVAGRAERGTRTATLTARTASSSS